MPVPELTFLCEHEPCSCPVENDIFADANGARFCSEDCARGVGCHHTGCACAKHEERSAG